LDIVDLFKPIVPEEKLHPNFRFIAQSNLCTPEMEVINSWAEGFFDRDGKFVKEFQTTFNSSFWELYLFACFKELGCSVDFSYNTPDFLVNLPQGEFIAEATIANHPDGFQPEWDKDLELLGKTNKEDILRLSTIRLSNAISSKYNKYNLKYSNLPHVKNKPFVICVAPFDQPSFSSQDSLAIVRLLYAYEAPLTIPGNQKGENIIVGESRCFRVQKSPGVNLELGLFTDVRMADVSAVFFNIRATFSKVHALAKEGDYPIIFIGTRMIKLENLLGSQRFFEDRANYQETILDGLHILINPFAKHPLDMRMFEGREVAIHNYDPETGNYLSEIPHGFLLQRMCHGIISSETTVEFKKSINEHPYQELSPEVWKEDELIHVGGQSGPFRDHHMAHYRGWTTLVSFHPIDKNWGTQAAHSICYKIPQYMAANMDEDIAFTAVPQWFSTKEKAYAAIKQKIDQIFDHTGTES
jgi:hypothetical protein